MTRKLFWQPSPMYGFIRSRILEGTMDRGPKLGCWLISSLRVRAGWGQVPIKMYPPSNEWPPNEPPGLDRIAKYNRSLFYQRLFNKLQLKQMLAAAEPTQISLPVTEQWFKAVNGEIDLPLNSSTFVGFHAVQPAGYNDPGEYFIFRNSWGEKWGDNGYGYLPYKYFDLYLQEAWRYNTTSPIIKKRHSKKSGIIEITWGCYDQLGGIIHCIDFFECLSQERIGWCFIVQTESGLNVEELFVRPYYRMKGFGTSLGQYALRLASDSRSRITFWIPHADTDTPNANLTALQRFCSKLKLSVKSSPKLWARFCAIPDDSDSGSLSINDPMQPPGIFFI